MKPLFKIFKKVKLIYKRKKKNVWDKMEMAPDLI